jgi:hypothetical protein
MNARTFRMFSDHSATSYLTCVLGGARLSMIQAQTCGNWIPPRQRQRSLRLRKMSRKERGIPQWRRHCPGNQAWPRCKLWFSPTHSCPHTMLGNALVQPNRDARALFLLMMQLYFYWSARVVPTPCTSLSCTSTGQKTS